MIWNYIYNFIYQFINTNDSTSLHHIYIYICLKINQRYEKKLQNELNILHLEYICTQQSHQLQ